jgi:hypothetical protein
MMSRLKRIIASAWKLAAGAGWDHDRLDPSQAPAVRLEPLGPWYYDLGRSIARGDYRNFDGQGIPRRQAQGALVYDPSLVASFSLAHMTSYLLKGGAGDRAKALAAARWLVEHQVADGPLAGAMPFTHSLGGVAAPVASALTQGQAMSALGRAWLVAREEAFARAAAAALGPLERGVEEGGLCARFHGSTSVWYEEYPCAEDPSHVLNGFIFALWGLRDVSLLGLAPKAGALYRAGLASLATHLPAFDSGYWSYYQCPDRARPRVASLSYHHFHCVMLRILSELESDNVFAQTAERWETYLGRRRCRLRALAAKLGDWR